MAGGIREGHELKFWTPGGSSTPIFTAEHLDVPLDFEAVGAAGSMLGTRALQIFDETTSVVRAVLRWTEFYAHESCGKCTPCREGTYWMKQVLRRHRGGQGHRRRHRHAARHLRQHPRALVLRARRRRHQPGHQRDQVLPLRVRGRHAPRPRGSSSRTSGPPASRRCRRDDRHDGDGAAPVAPARSSSPPPSTARSVSVPKGTLVIRAAEQIGVHVPRFCDHPLLDPVGACRQCLVEIATPGPDGTPASDAEAAALLRDRAHRGHGGQDAGDLAGRREGAARRDGVPAHQPPARLPGLRQGRRVPAAEPGDERRPGDQPVRRREAHVPQADQDLHPGAARPRALHPVPALHPVLARRSRATRSSTCSSAACMQQIGTFSPGVLGIATQRRADARRVGRAVRAATSPATRSRSARSAP